MACKDIQIRFDIVIQWLRVLKKVHPRFEGIEIDESPSTRTQVDQLEDALLENAVVSESDIPATLQEQVQSDVAVVREQPSDQEQGARSDVQSEAPHVIPMSSSLYTYRESVSANHQSETMMQQIQRVFEPPDPLGSGSRATETGEEALSVGGSTSLLPERIQTYPASSGSRATATGEDVLTVGGSTSLLPERIQTSSLEGTSLTQSGSGPMSTSSVPGTGTLSLQSSLTTTAPVSASPFGSGTAIRVCRTSDNPVCEYMENDAIFYTCFPQLFMFGRGINGCGPLSQKIIDHMLFQFTGSIARFRPATFLMFDQKRRHTASRNVCVRVRSNAEAFTQFSQLIADQEFIQQTRNAAANPNGEEAKNVMRRVSRMLQITGSTIPYSPLERSAGITTLYAYVRRFGIPSIFLTVSPDDVHEPLAIRLCFPTLCSCGFPANVTTSFLDALEAGNPEFLSCDKCQNTVNVDLSDSNLRKYIAENPAASAQVFQNLVTTLYTDVLGIEPEYAMKKTQPLQKRQGVFGSLQAVAGVIEVQGRLALHLHAVLFGGALPCWVLQKVAAHDHLARQVIDLMDTMFWSTMPADVHVKGLIRRLRKERVIPDTFRQIATPLQCDGALETKVYSCMESKQIHSHKASCRKGKYGHKGCRFSKPSPLCDVTGRVQLRLTVVNNNNTGSDRLVAVPQDTIDHDDTMSRWDHRKDPLRPVDKRCIVWELKRPQIKEENLPREVRAELDTLTAEEKFVVLRALEKRNGSVVEVHPIITAWAGCNTAAFVLGGVEQAKATIFYLIKYMTKDTVKLSNTLSLIKATREHVQKHPSRAADVEEETRTGKYFLTRLLNQIGGSMEVSDTQVLSCLIGQKSFIGTSDTWYTYIWPAVQFVKTERKTEQQRRRRLRQTSPHDSDDGDGDSHSYASESEDSDHCIFDDDSDNEWWNSGDYDEDDNQDSGEEDEASTRPTRDENTRRAFKTGSASVFKNSQGESVAVEQHVHYRYRGDRLEEMSYLEYMGIIKVVHRNRDEGETQNDDSTQRTGPGRPQNQIFEFAEGHELRDSHVQQLRSKHVTPILAGPHVPSYPKRPHQDAHGRPPREWRKKAEVFALYMMTLCCPWNLETGIPKEGTTWKRFCEWMAKLEGVELEGVELEVDDPPHIPDRPCFVDRCRGLLINNIARCESQSYTRKRLLTSYRNRAQAMWPGQPGSVPDFSGDFELHAFRHLNRTPASDTQEEDQEAARARRQQDLEDEATSMLNEANVDERASRQLRDFQKKDDFVSESLSALDEVFGTLDDLINAPRVTNQLSDTDNNESGHVTHHGVVHDSTQVPHVKAVLENLERDTGEILEGQDTSIQGDSSGMDVEPQDPRTDVSLNDGQKTVVCAAQTYLIQERNHRVFRDDRHPHPEPKGMLVHGGPGVGKTYTINKIADLAKFYESKLLFTAYTGSAANNSQERGRTLHQMLGFDTRSNRVDQCTYPPQPGPQRMVELRKRFENVSILVIDEVSLVGPVHLGHINQRLKQIKQDPEKDFGGILVIALGDFFQLPPVMPKVTLPVSVINQMCQIRPGDTSVGEENTPGVDGAMLFSKFHLYKLNQQMRAAEDPEHCSLITALRDINVIKPISDWIVQKLKSRELKKQDFEDDATWSETPIIVTSNAEREALNYHQAQRFAYRHGVPVVRWKLPLAEGPYVRSLTPEQRKEVYDTNPQLWGYFVYGAPGYCTQNVNASKGVANGSSVIYRSLTLRQEEAGNEEGDDVHTTQLFNLHTFQDNLNHSRPGEMIDLHRQPYSINVELVGAKHEEWNDSDIAVRGANCLGFQPETRNPIIPMTLSSSKEEVQVRPIAGRSVPGQVKITDHRVELGFAITFHKVQGKTVSKVILDINDKSFIPKLTLAGLYVGLTRVKKGADIRILPVKRGGNLDYLKALKGDRKLATWLKGFTQTDDAYLVWDQEKAQQEWNQERYQMFETANEDHQTTQQQTRYTHSGGRTRGLQSTQPVTGTTSLNTTGGSGRGRGSTTGGRGRGRGSTTGGRGRGSGATGSRRGQSRGGRGRGRGRGGSQSTTGPNSSGWRTQALSTPRGGRNSRTYSWGWVPFLCDVFGWPHDQLDPLRNTFNAFCVQNGLPRSWGDLVIAARSVIVWRQYHSSIPLNDPHAWYHHWHDLIHDYTVSIRQHVHDDSAGQPYIDADIQNSFEEIEVLLAQGGYHFLGVPQLLNVSGPNLGLVQTMVVQPGQDWTQINQVLRFRETFSTIFQQYLVSIQNHLEQNPGWVGDEV